MEKLVDSFIPTTNAEISVYGDVMQGETFTNGLGYPVYLYSAKFYLKKQGAPTGNMYAKVYKIGQGVYGTNAAPANGDTELATSDAISVDVLTATLDWKEFIFPGSGVRLESGTGYCVVLYAPSSDSSNSPMLPIAFFTGTTDDGNLVQTNDGGTTWLGTNTIQVGFYLYGIDYVLVSKPTASPYTNVNSIGRQNYDQADLFYDDTAFYDSVDQSAYTNLSKPISGITWGQAHWTWASAKRKWGTPEYININKPI